MSTSVITKNNETRVATKTNMPSISSKTQSDVTFTLERAFDDTNARGWIAVPIGTTSLIPMTVKSISGTSADVRLFNISNVTSTAGTTLTILIVKIA